MDIALELEFDVVILEARNIQCAGDVPYEDCLVPVLVLGHFMTFFYSIPAVSNVDILEVWSIN